MPQPTITTTYAGEFAGQYIAAALLSSPTLDKGLVTVKPNVKYKEVYKTFDAVGTAGSYLTADASCDFTPEVTVDLAETILTVKELQVNLQLCKTPFKSDWEAVQMGYSAFDNLPTTFSDFLIGQLAAQVASNNEQIIWNGASASAGEYDGFLGQLTGAVPVTGTTVDATNVIDELGKVVDAIPSALYGKEDLLLYIPQNVAKAYVRALGGFASIGANGLNNQGTMWYNNATALSFDGVQLAVADGLPSNTMVAGLKSQFVFGTGLMNDWNLVKLLDMSDLDGSENVRAIMRFTAGTAVHNVGQAVLYS